MNRNKIFNTSKLLMLLAAAFMVPLFLVDCSDAALPDGAQLSLVRRGLWVTKTEVSFGEEKELEQTLTISGENTPWQLTGLPEWLTASPSSGNGAAEITLVAEANHSVDEARAAVLTLESTAADYQYSQIITVNQPGIKPYIVPSEDALSFIPKGEAKDISVSSNVEWEAVCNDSWVSLKVVSATQLRITAKENLESKTQRATVHLVRSGTETTLAVITLTQAEAGVAPDSYENIDFAVDGETRNVSFTADASWTADASDASWLDISPKSGNAGRATLTITAHANNSANARPNGYVYIRIGGTQKLAIPVSQGGVKISVDQNHIEFDCHSQDTSVAVTANASWSVVSKPAWLDVQLPDVLIGTNQLIITPSDNTDTASRTGEVIIGRAGFSGNQVVRVTQQGADAPQLVERLDFPATAARQVVNIDTDGTWTAATTDSWVHLSPISGQGYGTLSVSVDANLGDETRTGYVTITIGRTTQTVAVVQVGRYITLSCDDVITASTPATVNLSVQTATEWTAVSNVEWLTVDPQQGQGDATLTVAVADNPSAYERTGGTITVKSGNVTQAFTFTQPGRHLSLSTTSLAFSYEGGTSAPVIVTTDGTYEVTTSEEWLTINRSNNTFTVTAAENSGAKRNATVTVALTDLKAGESLEYTISVTQPANPIYSGEKRTFTVNGVSFNMIKVETGSFLMGGNGEDDGKPVHQVTFTNDYYIGETEVTQELWIAVTGSNPSYYKSSNQLPVEYVSWNDCQTFITKLNALTGRTFRLPTEAEWEFAARGGNASEGYTYSGSNNVDEVAWYWYNIPSQTSGQAGYGTQLVATKAPNELGIYDMSGNICEWCQDWYGSYSSSAQTNPTGPTSGSKRVIRGGCWNYTDGNCRVANRDSEVPSDMYSNIGFRLALTSEQDDTSHTTYPYVSSRFDANKIQELWYDENSNITNNTLHEAHVTIPAPEFGYYYWRVARNCPFEILISSYFQNNFILNENNLAQYIIVNDPTPNHLYSLGKAEVNFGFIILTTEKDGYKANNKAKGCSGTTYTLSVGDYNQVPDWGLYATANGKKELIAYLEYDESGAQNINHVKIVLNKAAHRNDYINSFVEDLLNYRASDELAYDVFKIILGFHFNWDGEHPYATDAPAFQFRFLRPINMFCDELSIYDSAYSTQVFNLYDLVHLADWRDQWNPTATSAQNKDRRDRVVPDGGKYIVDYWYYYNIKHIIIGNATEIVDPAQETALNNIMHTNMNGNDIKITILAHVSNNVEFTYVPPQNQDASIGDPDFYGCIKYKNMSSAVYEYDVTIPVLVCYEWGHLYKEVKIRINKK